MIASLRGDGIVKGRRRDTAWLSIVEAEWPAQRVLFEAWLDDSNLDADGVALNSLSPHIGKGTGASHFGWYFGNSELVTQAR